MSFPTAPVSTTNLDSGGADSPSSARGDLLDLTQKVNEIIVHGEPLTLAHGGTVNKAVHQARVAMTLADINLSQGAIYAKTITAPTAFTVSSVPPNGTFCSFILEVINGGSAAVTWWAGVKWPGGTVPPLMAAGRDVLGFYTIDGGATWTGLIMGRDVK